MTDLTQVVIWTLVLGTGLGFCVVAKRLGMPVTYVRDLMHVGSGVWVLGWSDWHGVASPIGITTTAFVLTAAVPRSASRFAISANLLDSFSNKDETWAGVAAYVAAFALFTAIGLTHRTAPAAGALLALAWGDGLGGAVGRRFGRHFFHTPGGKRKSLEGSLAVAIFASAGIAAAFGWFKAPAQLGVIILGGLVAALTEALSPRSTDNMTVPVAVWALLGATT